MQESALAKKMKLKPGYRAAVVNAPDGYLQELEPLPDGVEVANRLQGNFDWLQVFVKESVELEKLAPRAIRTLTSSGLLWISFPKGTSKIQTDLTRDKGWDVLQDLDLKWINLVSVNDTWSAFSLRLYKDGEKRQSFR